jgi:hypothetical protein
MRNKEQTEDMKKCKKENRTIHNLGKEFVVTFYKTENVTKRYIRVTIFAVEKQ